MRRPIVSMKHFFLAISPSPPSLQSPLLVQRSILLFAGPARSRVTLSSSLWKMARVHQRIIAFAKFQTPRVKKAA